jgi:rSAM/selenodomain-associated transferase 2
MKNNTRSGSMVSVVIPVLDDTRQLNGLLNSLRSMMARSDEIIVVDGSPDRNCAPLAKHYSCTCLYTRPGRGHQLHTGAQHATGDILWFLHADLRPGASAITRIRREMADGAIGGYFGFKFLGHLSWYKRLLAWLINIRARVGVPYGDQGLFFCRSFYTDTDGFADAPLFEEVTLVKAARRRGRFVRIATPVGVSSRKWERDGWIRRTLENRLLALGHMLGISPETLAARYRQKC